MDEQLHSPARRLIELRIAHAELDGRIDTLMGCLDTASARGVEGAAGPEGDTVAAPPVDELALRRLKKQRLALRDEIARLERASDPDEPA
ncbi:YdcH family protein [Roseateles sp. MS654]|uniref:YdcH family protein n=1 Tax=Roseateles sp. MS654 TaxID=3412685 RepID=UPI003C2F2FC9